MPLNGNVHLLQAIQDSDVEWVGFGTRNPETGEVQRRVELGRDGERRRVVIHMGSEDWAIPAQAAADLGACLLEAACYEEAHEWIDTGRFTFTEPPPPDVHPQYQVLRGQAQYVLANLPDNYVQCTVTSPPYYQIFQYGDETEGELGMEETPDGYLGTLRWVATELLRATKPTGVLFLNIGETWNGSGGPGGDYRDQTGEYRVVRTGGARVQGMPKKARLLIPELIATVFRDAGWIPRQLLMWNTENPFRGAADRPSQSFEWIHVFTKATDYTWHRERVLMDRRHATEGQLSKRYESQARYPHYATEGREDPSELKRRTIRAINNRAGKVFPRAILPIPSGNQPVITMPDGAVVRGIASFPELLPEILSNWASDPGDVVLDPFSGMGTTGVAALRWKRHYLGIELVREYCEASVERLKQAGFGEPLPGGELPPGLNEHALRAAMPLWGES